MQNPGGFSMDVNTQKISDIVQQYVNDVQKQVKVNKAVLYGSYAKGNYDEQSDVDIAIFSESFTGKNSIEINSFLFSLARKYKEICIEPIGFNYEDLFDDNPFVKEILNSGKEIYLQ
jgi:predicted nucleotidyltransferase